MTSPRRKWLIFAAVALLALVIFSAWIIRGNPSERSIDATTGKDPTIVAPETERIPSVALAKTVGWGENEAPVAAKGLTVVRFADKLDHPRTMLTLPNGDVLVAEANRPEGSRATGFVAFFRNLFMGEVGAGGPSPNRIILLRDADGDGKAEQRSVFRSKDLDSPSGMAWSEGKLYIANHNALLAFDFTPGATELSGEPKKLMDLPGNGNHWMRNVIVSPDGKLLYIAVGSASNIGEGGMDAEKGRAAIWEYTIATGRHRIYAEGMRNPNGLGWNPATGELWTVVNERDMMGPDLVPDYLSNVPIGAQYGWPWLYWKDEPDWRVDAPIPNFLPEYTRKPEYALGAHTAPLGLVFVTGGQIMGNDFANGAFIARHGSWNRKPLSGYDVVFVKFDANGNPQGMPVPVLTGFLTGKGNDTHGRPTWLAWDKTGALLTSDDTAGVIWRTYAAGAAPVAAPKPVVVGTMPPQRELRGDLEAQFGPDIRTEMKE